MDVCKLNYKKFGEHGEIVVILHGLFGVLDNWKTFARKLSTQYQVFIVDQRNHGKSAHHVDMDYELMVGDLAAFFGAHGISKAHLMGHSMGGKVAMLFALRHSVLLSSLIVVDIAPKKYKPVHEPIFQAMLDVDFEIVKSRQDIEQQLAQKIKVLVIRQFLMKNIQRWGDRFGWKLNLPVIHYSYLRLNDWALPESTFEGAVLFIKGALSPYIIASDRARILHYFPKAKLAVVDGAGHWVHAERPDKLQKIVENFMKINFISAKV